MSSQVRELLASGFGQLRHEPTAKRIRPCWAARRSWTAPGPCWSGAAADRAGIRRAGGGRAWRAVPAGQAAGAVGGDVGVSLADVTALRVLDPSVPFTVHSAEGEMVDLRAAEQRRPGPASAANPDLAGLVILDFGAFDAWYEEDELNVGHPRDPFHRIDVLPSSRQVRLELDGQVLAVSSRPVLLFETMLPARYYLPRADYGRAGAQLDQDLVCLQGAASYFSASVGGLLVPDLAWSTRIRSTTRPGSAA